MLPPLTTLEAKVGDDAVFEFLVQNDDDSSIDTTGWEAEWSVNKGRKGGLGDWTYLSTDSPVVTFDRSGSPHFVVVSITPAMTREWSGGKAVVLQAELTITDAGGKRLSIFDGSLDLRGEVRFEP